MQKRDFSHAHGHRQRAKARFLENQKNGTRQEDYEILELLLTYTIARKDTKPIGKNLLSEFGTIKGILNAPRADLANIDDIGPSSMAFINAEHEFIKRATAIDDKIKVINIPRETLLSYAHKIKEDISKNSKEFWLIALGLNNRFITSARIENIRNIDNAFEDLRPFVQVALNANAKSVILVRNRLDDRISVENKDIENAQILAKLFQDINIKMHEHIIITKEKAIFLLAQGVYELDSWKHKKFKKEFEEIDFDNELAKKFMNSALDTELAEISEHQLLGYFLYRAGFKNATRELLNIFAQNCIGIKKLLSIKFNILENILMKHFKDKAMLEKMSVFIALQREMAMRYLLDNYYINPINKRKNFEKVDDFAHIAYLQLAHCQREEIWLAHFNNDNILLKFEMLCKQEIDSAVVDISQIVAQALNNKSAALIVCHNHPAGTIRASQNDYDSTKILNDVLKQLGAKVQEHLVVADRSCTFIIADKVEFF